MSLFQGFTVNPKLELVKTRGELAQAYFLRTAALILPFL